MDRPARSQLPYQLTRGLTARSAHLDRARGIDEAPADRPGLRAWSDERYAAAPSNSGATSSTVASTARVRPPSASAATAPRATTTAPTCIAGIEPVDEGLAGRVRAVRREDRGEDRDAEDATELADRVVRAGRLALLLGPDGREDDVGDRGEEQAHPDARDDERRDDHEVVDGRA